MFYVFPNFGAGGESLRESAERFHSDKDKEKIPVGTILGVN